MKLGVTQVLTYPWCWKGGSKAEAGPRGTYSEGVGRVNCLIAVFNLLHVDSAQERYRIADNAGGLNAGR